MYDIKQLEMVRKEYLEQVEENKRLIEDNIRDIDLLPIKREVSKRAYEKCGKGKNYDKRCDEYLEIYNSHVEEFVEDLEDLGLKIDIINKMIKECKNGQHSE